MSNVQIVKDLYEAFGRGDVGAVLAALDPKIEWREAESNPYKPDGKPWFGGEEGSTSRIRPAERDSSTETLIKTCVGVVVDALGARFRGSAGSTLGE